MKKVLHLWGITDSNAGDFLLGPATRQWFENNVFKANFSHKSCRDNFDESVINKINSIERSLDSTEGKVETLKTSIESTNTKLSDLESKHDRDITNLKNEMSSQISQNNES